MDFKNILVHVNVSRHCRKRLELAASLAKFLRVEPNRTVSSRGERSIRRLECREGKG